MTRYHYRSIDDKGRIVKGEREAINELELAAGLAQQGLTLLSARRLKEKSIRSRQKLSRREMIDFFYYLETLLRAGVPIIDTLRDLGDSSATSAVAQIALGAADAIAKGDTLSQALFRFGIFPEELVQLIAAGEHSGTLPTVLAEIVRSLKWQDELVSRTKKALMYPAFALTVILGTVTFLMSYLVPQLLAFIRQMGGELPFYTRALIWVSEFVQNEWYVLFGAPVALTFLLSGLARANRNFRRILHAGILRVSVLGPVLKKLILARAIDTLALMYRSGISILEALDQVARAIANLAVQEAIARARDDVASGMPLSAAFAQQEIFPPLVIRMMRVGENTGALDEALGNVSYFYLRDIDDAIGKMQAMLEPALTVVLGLILGWIMLSVLGPIYDTISKIKM